MPIRARVALNLIVAIVACLVLATAANPPGDARALRDSLTGARQLAIDHFAQIQSATKSGTDIIARLDADLTGVSLADPTDTGAMKLLAIRAQLDESYVAQLVSGSSSTDVTGTSLRLFKASADGTLQPVAVYEPSGSTALRPLVLMLHDRGKTETELITDATLRGLADRYGVVVATPWARGDRDYDDVTSKDVYDALAFLETHYAVDRRREFLAGESAGGFGVFMIAPSHPQYWAASLSIAGTLTNDDKDRFVRTMTGKPIFIVAGSNDPQLNVQYVRGAAAFLNASGIDCHYYEERGGTHSLASLQPSIDRAWRDMLEAVRNVAPDIAIPSPVTTASQRY